SNGLLAGGPPRLVEVESVPKLPLVAGDLQTQKIGGPVVSRPRRNFCSNRRPATHLSHGKKKRGPTAIAGPCIHSVVVPHRIRFSKSSTLRTEISPASAGCVPILHCKPWRR